MATVFSRALNDESIGNVFTITEKATTRAFSWLKALVMTNLRVDLRFNLRFVQYGHSFHYPGCGLQVTQLVRYPLWMSWV